MYSVHLYLYMRNRSISNSYKYIMLTSFLLLSESLTIHIHMFIENIHITSLSTPIINRSFDFFSLEIYTFKVFTFNEQNF